jgi:hypothetical protein
MNTFAQSLKCQGPLSCRGELCTVLVIVFHFYIPGDEHVSQFSKCELCHCYRHFDSSNHYFVLRYDNLFHLLIQNEGEVRRHCDVNYRQQNVCNLGRRVKSLRITLPWPRSSLLSPGSGGAGHSILTYLDWPATTYTPLCIAGANISISPLQCSSNYQVAEFHFVLRSS